MNNIQHIQALRSSFEKLTEEVASLKGVHDKFTLQLKLQALCDLSHLANNIASNINTSDIKLLHQIFSQHTDPVTDLLTRNKQTKKNSASSSSELAKITPSEQQTIIKKKALRAQSDPIHNQTDFGDACQLNKKDVFLIEEFEVSARKRKHKDIEAINKSVSLHPCEDFGSIEIKSDSIELIDLNTLNEPNNPTSKVKIKNPGKKFNPKKNISGVDSKSTDKENESASDFINRLVRQNIAKHKAFIQKAKL